MVGLRVFASFLLVDWPVGVVVPPDEALHCFQLQLELVDFVGVDCDPFLLVLQLKILLFHLQLVEKLILLGFLASLDHL